MDGEELNDYVMAIRSVGDILQHYDSDKRYQFTVSGPSCPRHSLKLVMVLSSINTLP